MSQRLVVTRTPERDSAHWVPGAPAATLLPKRKPDRSGWLWLLLMAALALFGVLRHRDVREITVAVVTFSVADVLPVQSGVTIGETDALRLTRASEGDRIVTDGSGRARIRIDAGASIVLDTDSALVVHADGADLERGRAFVELPAGARASIGLGEARIVGTDARFSLAAADQTTVFVAEGELTVDSDGDETTVGRGETATLNEDGVDVAPELGFEDWTHGLARPWGADGPARSAVGGVWGRPQDELGQSGSAMTFREHAVDVQIRGELAETRVESVFFNADSRAIRGDFRMAIPKGAVVSSFSTTREGRTRRGRLLLAEAGSADGGDVLEWAGDGWVRGRLDAIESGKTVRVEITYHQWLDAERHPDGTATLRYRYPMVGTDHDLTIGEFRATIDASDAEPAAIDVTHGATIDGAEATWTASEFRPTADLTYALTLQDLPKARLYVGEEQEDGFVPAVVRTEAEAPSDPQPVRVAILLDRSQSHDAALFEASKNVVRSLLEGLRDEDEALLIAVGNRPAAVGGDGLQKLADERRRAMLTDLDALTPGGAGDLAAAIDEASRALGQGAHAGLVLYVGDGWPTLGPRDPLAFQERFERLPAGAPRFAAVAVGPHANRPLLQELAGKSGSLVEIESSIEAPAVAATLLSTTLVPTAAGFLADPGPALERIYPRGRRSVPLGGTVTLTGRMVGAAPTQLRVEHLGAAGLVTREVELIRIDEAPPEAVLRTGAAARIDGLSHRRGGMQAARSIAHRGDLLSPATAFVVGSDRYVPSPIRSRVLDLSAIAHPAFGTALTHAPTSALELSRGFADGHAASPSEAIRFAARRKLYDVRTRVQTCRDARAAVLSALPTQIEVRATITNAGRFADPTFDGLGQPLSYELEECIRLALSSVTTPVFGFEQDLEIVYVFRLPPPEPNRGRTCSRTSTIGVSLRRGVWTERLQRQLPIEVIKEARDGCELTTWTAKRSLLELVLEHLPDGVGRLELALALRDIDEQDAADFVEREALRRAATPDQLRSMRAFLLQHERFPEEAFRKAYEAARSDEKRLDVVREALVLAPHAALAQRQLVQLLATTDRIDELVAHLARIEGDPMIGADIVAEGAAALHQGGRADFARILLGGLVERAPSDPLIASLVSDQLRRLGEHDLSRAVVERLDELLPGDAQTVLRRALVERALGRLDLARRLAAGVGQTGGRRADRDAAGIGATLALSIGTQARTDDNIDELRRATRPPPEIFGRSASHLLLVSLPPQIGATVQIEMEDDPDAGPIQPAFALPGLGLYALRVDAELPAGAQIAIRSEASLLPGHQGTVTVELLSSEDMTRQRVEVPVDGSKEGMAVPLDAAAARLGDPLTLKPLPKLAGAGL